MSASQRSWTAEEWKIIMLASYWQYFISPTFAQVGTRWGRIHRVENWLRWVARQGNSSKRQLVYVIRWERGELGDRPHCHLFLGGMNGVKNPLSMCGILADNWVKRHGRCQVRMFDQAQLYRSANYVGGKANDQDWGKNRYEISKFGNPNAEVYFSRCAEETLRKIQGVAPVQ